MHAASLITWIALATLALAAPPARAEGEAPAPSPAASPAPTPPPADAPVAPQPAPTPAPSPPGFAPTLPLSVPWAGPTGRGVSFGIEEGGWSGIWGTGLRSHIPFNDFFGVTLRADFITGPTGSTPDNLSDHLGGRIDVIGKSPVFLNLIRLYGGGGVEAFAATGSQVDHTLKWSGGGEFGFEFFLNRLSSFYLEVGGHGGVDDGLPGGQTVIAGMNLYPFS